MPSSFFELSVATTGLFTSKAAMNVINNNIANADSVGYSRQVALVRARTPLNYQNGRGMIGTGSEMFGVGQMRNFYLDTKYWTSNGVLGEYSAKNTQNKMLESIFKETDSTGFNASLNNLFGVLNRDLSTDSGNNTPRLAAISAAQSLATYFNSTAASLENQQKEINTNVKSVVDQINNLGLQIQSLNKQIYVSELDGSQANDLRDTRALIIDELSKYVNVEVKEVELNKDLLTGKSEKRFQVSINGYDFVNHYDLNTLNCVERTVKNNAEDVEGLYDIFWASGIKFNSEYSLNTMGGELKGLLEVRDGNNMNGPTVRVAKVENATNGTGGVKITLDNWSREDLPSRGTITIGSKSYSYENFVYDPVANTMTIEIPPSGGTMTLNGRLMTYSALKITGNDITFSLAESVTDNDVRGKIKIGDMELSKGSYTIGADGRTITLINSSTAADIKGLTGGQKAQIGSNLDYKGIPYFTAKLNTFARGLARAFNLGQDVSGNKLEGVTGHYYAYNMLEGNNTGFNFFTYKSDPNTVVEGYGKEHFDYHNITAKNFSVAKELLDDPKALAAALSQNPDASDNLALLSLVSLKNNPDIFDEGGFGNYISSIVGELGVVTNESVTFEKNYVDITASINNQRLSVSSVDLNEEMAAMIQYQQIYNAAAKLISILNGIYDTTINKLGI